jgi:hypothetical protein
MSDGGSSVAGALGAIMGGASPGSSAQNSFSRSLSTTASVGISLIVLRIVASAVQAAREDIAERPITGRGATEDDGVSLLWNRRGIVFQFLRSFLHRMIVQKGVTTIQSNEEEDDDNVPVIHEGSCHCQSVRFEVGDGAILQLPDLVVHPVSLETYFPISQAHLSGCSLLRL